MLKPACFAQGDVTTVNLTIFKAGVQHNVVPAEAECGFDIRLPPTVDLDAFKATVEQWAADAVRWLLSNGERKTPPTSFGIPRT